MAGDWIKMRLDLQTHPKIVRILSATKSDKFRAIGGLHAVWCVFDTHSVDGRLNGYTPDALDHIIGWVGFANAMIAVGWLVVADPETLVLPEFDEHNGASGKRRAEDAKRKRSGRKADKCPQNVHEMSEPDADKLWSREEKRREDIPTTSIEVVGGAHPKRGSRKCPASFTVTDELKSWAAENCPGVNLDAETAKLRDHTFGAARTDWPGTWRNWMRKSFESPGRPRARPPAPVSFEGIDYGQGGAL